MSSGLAELDEDSAGGTRVHERDSLAFRSDSRHLIHELDPCFAAPSQRSVEIRHGEADVMDPGTALRDEATNRRSGIVGFQELDERPTGVQRDYAGAVGVVYGHVAQAENVAKERQLRVDRRDGDSDVRDPRGRSGWKGH